MQIVYFDEVKYQKGRSPFYWLAAVIAEGDLIQDLERRVNDLAAEVFGTRMLTKETEFHASDILNGNKQFKGWDWTKKLDTLKKLITIFGTAENLGKIYVKMDIEKMVRDDAEDMAFMFLVERVPHSVFAEIGCNHIVVVIDQPAAIRRRRTADRSRERPILTEDQLAFHQEFSLATARQIGKRLGIEVEVVASCDTRMFAGVLNRIFKG